MPRLWGRAAERRRLALREMMRWSVAVGVAGVVGVLEASEPPPA